MNINLGYIHEIVMVADHAPLVNLKNLSQKERNLLNRVCYLSQNFRRNFMLRELNTQQETLEKLKNKLEAINGKRVPSNIIIAFFKFIGNKLDLRISSTKLRDEVKQTADHLAIPKPFRDLFDVFEDWLLSFNARKFIKETIEGFYKITLYRDEIANILATKSSEESQKFIFEKTGLLMLTEIKEQHHMALHEAPKVLLEAFKLALETNRMDAFFEQALKSENGNNSLEARYRRIADWMVQEFEREDYLHVPKDDAYI